MNFSQSVLTAVCAALSTGAFADSNDIKASNNQVGIQYVLTNVHYTETGNGTLSDAGRKLDTEDGTLSGYALNGSVMSNMWLGNDYFYAEYSQVNGNTGYKGSLASDVPPVYGSVVGSSGAVLKDFRLRYGKGFVINDQVMVTPYGEIGHHEWDRNVTNVGYQQENYTNSYAGIGALVQYSPKHQWVLSGNVLLARTFAANIDVPNVSVLIAGANSSSVGLSASNLYRIGAVADYAFSKKLHGNIGLDYTTFDYGASALQSGGWYEPNSTTDYTTIRLGVDYAF